ncbi:Hsp20 family protein [Candidatus Pelagibacter bacterium nBUS_25]|uniref:Hsp20 family protein n=1 Tax=Candidatus Pelagibacter bacterium nBUS_25 TaxID=3374187 RepID=UPI003EB81466
MKSLSIIDSLKPFSVGFDDMFKHFEDIHHRELDAFETNRGGYNITKIGKQDYNIEVALPGVDKKNVKVSVEDNVLIIKSSSNNKIEKDDKEYLYKGVEKENVCASFIISKDIKVKEAIMEKGLLSIKLREEKPLPKYVKEIPITSRQ